MVFSYFPVYPFSQFRFYIYIFFCPFYYALRPRDWTPAVPWSGHLAGYASALEH